MPPRSLRALLAPPRRRASRSGTCALVRLEAYTDRVFVLPANPCVVLIRYHLQHPKNPRPLRFSRLRTLRHWTIHRAWQLYRAQQRRAQELELERQYNSMREACEALRLMGEEGLAVAEQTQGPTGGYIRRANGEGGPERAAKTAREAAEAEVQKDVGKLYRVAMRKEGIWAGVPIEYARCQTDTPPRNGWDHAWTRR
jgi:large subunit ribosomal protein L40